MNYKLQIKYITLLKPYYDESHRFYHTWDHIREMLDYVGANNIELSDEQYIAILAHDLVYVPGAAVNEELSGSLIVTLQQQTQEEGLCDFDGPTVCRLIMATKNHVSLSFTDRILIDLDLLRFSAGPEQYKTHSRNIRREYAVYSDHVYARGRISFLRDFLSSRKSIYVSGFFDANMEKIASKNIKDEIASLEAML
jgi:predicted metal-dependent HD superfamily phosphohydrolase